MLVSRYDTSLVVVLELVAGKKRYVFPGWMSSSPAARVPSSPTEVCFRTSAGCWLRSPRHNPVSQVDISKVVMLVAPVVEVGKTKVGLGLVRGRNL